MLPDETVDHHAEVRARIIRMANQIADFFASKPHEQGVQGLAGHINDFWEPRMRRHLFDILAAGGDELKPLVRDAAALIRQPAPQAARSDL